MDRSKKDRVAKSGQRLQTLQSRRRFIKNAGRLMASAAAVGIGLIKPAELFSAASTSREIKIGTFGPSHCAATLVYTQLKGFFREERLSANLTNYSDMSAIARDLASGRLDFGQLVVPLALALHTGARPFTTRVPVVIPQIAGTNGSAFVVRPGSGIHQFSDCKGKNVASHNKLSMNYILNMQMMELNGLEPDKDVHIKIVDLDKVIEAMKKGEIDAFIMPEPTNSMAEVSGTGSMQLLSKYIWPNHPCCAVVCRKDYFEKNPELASAVIRTLTRGGLAINNVDTRAETVDLLRSTSAYAYDRVPRDVLLKAFTPGRSDFDPFPYQSSAIIVIEIMKRRGLLPGGMDEKRLAKEVFLSDFSRKIMTEIGATPPASDFRPEKIMGKIRNFV